MKPSRIVLLISAICIAAAAAFHGRLLGFPRSLLIIHGDPARADAIVVLCGGGGERIDYGVHLFRQGYADRILFCGTSAEESFARSILEGEGVPVSGPVEIRGGLAGTYESLEYLKGWASREGISSCLVVSSPLHMRRISFLVSRLFGRGPPRMVLCPTRDTEDGEEWWRRPSARRAVAGEWKKLAWSWLRYGS